MVRFDVEASLNAVEDFCSRIRENSDMCHEAIPKSHDFGYVKQLPKSHDFGYEKQLPKSHDFGYEKLPFSATRNP
ncbi:MAG TPA: hypothetical protein PLY87_14645 [Planctomycetaceae bacterium]|nr:hypothetical protein [Planctomycetaceae bacterium]HQZ66324.1 hypothetical protein [Planctomycetaceae bacterium]